MNEDEKCYFYRRAEVEMMRAQNATCCEAEAAHRGLAKNYLARIESGEQLASEMPAAGRGARA
ncbi:hypothetical protein [uncultured Sphingomonas sp.]|uniref:hypothetical protein n=1 Tax=uncultured Sphingomonas sp. TaxID=158754 RepID=UPI0025D2CB6B|nr:hypothetical protein [uncultured Sphingomonas sp.]